MHWIQNSISLYSDIIIGWNIIRYFGKQSRNGFIRCFYWFYKTYVTSFTVWYFYLYSCSCSSIVNVIVFCHLHRLQAFVAPLVFESAFNTEYHIIRREFAQSLILAGPGVILNCILTGLFCHYCFPYSWTPEQAVAFGAIVSATDVSYLLCIIHFCYVLFWSNKLIDT